MRRRSFEEWLQLRAKDLECNPRCEMGHGNDFPFYDCVCTVTEELETKDCKECLGTGLTACPNCLDDTHQSIRTFYSEYISLCAKEENLLMELKK